jgi:hypothetical protein
VGGLSNCSKFAPVNNSIQFNIKNHFMKNSVIFLGLCLFSSVFAQSVEKAYFENNPALGGDVIIQSASVKIVGEEIFKTFEIESFEEGRFYMNAWILVPLTEDGYPEYKVAINGLLTEYSFKPQTDNWQSLALTDAEKSAATVKLRKGKNSISVIGKKPGVPTVEFVKLSQNPANTGISDKKYREFVEKAKSNSLYNAGDDNTVVLRSGNASSAGIGTAGEIYDYILNMPVNYTTLLYFYWGWGEDVTISTTQTGGTGHVIEVFQRDNPITYTWTSPVLYGSGSMNIPITYSDWYIVRARSLSPFTSGTLNITVNGVTYSNMPITESALQVTNHSGGSKNYFTCKLGTGGDTWLFLQEYAQLPSPIIFHNDDGGTRSDGYKWNNASLATTSQLVYFALVSSYQSNTPSTTCDLYLDLAQSSSTVRGYFPNLAADNSFKSGPETSVYNCFSWSVGVTSSWYQWMSSLADFDSFFQSYGYTRSGATADNAAIALWTNNGNFTHASVRKNSTITKPHGFEWESKCGQLERVMHIRDALNGSSYGDITYYYKPISGTVVSAVNESYFSQSDLDRITFLKDGIPATVVSGFETKYLTWKSTWSRPEIAIHSNYRKYAESEEYNSLLEYCTKYGKATWPLFIDKLAQGDIFVGNLLEVLTYTGKKTLTEDIVASFIVETGKPLPSTNSILIDYSKELLDNEKENILESIWNIPAVEEEALEVDANVRGQEIILSLNTGTGANASVKVYDLAGTVVYEASYIVSNGRELVVISAANFRKGIYVVSVNVNGKSISQKVTI